MGLKQPWHPVIEHDSVPLKLLNPSVVWTELWGQSTRMLSTWGTGSRSAISPLLLREGASTVSGCRDPSYTGGFLQAGLRGVLEK